MTTWWTCAVLTGTTWPRLWPATASAPVTAAGMSHAKDHWLRCPRIARGPPRSTSTTQGSPSHLSARTSTHLLVRKKTKGQNRSNIGSFFNSRIGRHLVLDVQLYYILAQFKKTLSPLGLASRHRGAPTEDRKFDFSCCPMADPSLEFKSTHWTNQTVLQLPFSISAPSRSFICGMEAIPKDWKFLNSLGKLKPKCDRKFRFKMCKLPASVRRRRRRWRQKIRGDQHSK